MNRVPIPTLLSWPMNNLLTYTVMLDSLILAYVQFMITLIEYRFHPFIGHKGL